MATSFSTASSSAVVAGIPTRKPSFILSKTRHFYQSNHPKVIFPVSPKPKLRLFLSKPACRTVAAKAQLNQVSVEGSNNAPKSRFVDQEIKVKEPSKESSAPVVASEESISEFMNQVADLVKLVDSRDIVELQLKQLDCEILIRKKEAIAPTQSPAPMYMMQPPPPVAAPTSAAPPPSQAPALPAPVSAAPAAKATKSSIPPLASPMAGTFYRCPGPGEPPFVKVGDKVQKGQVLCIIEAMKLMNEIQAEQAGTVVEVVAEDGKPVSKDSPLFVIQP